MTSQVAVATRRLLRLPEVMQITGLSRPTIYRMIERGEFPRQVKQGRTSAWPSNNVDAYLDGLLPNQRAEG